MKRILLLAAFYKCFAIHAQDTAVSKLMKWESTGSYYEIIDNLKTLESTDCSPEEHFIYGNAFKRMFKYKQAIHHFEKALSSDSLNLKYLSTIGDLYKITGNLDFAELAFQKVLSLDTNNFNAKIQLANIYKSQKKYQQAFEIYTELHKRDFYNPYFWEKMGYCKYLQDSLYESMYYYANAFLCDSSDLNVINSLCNLFRRTKNYQKGLTSANDGLKADSLSTLMLRHRAFFSQKLEFYDSAINDYNRLIALNDTNYDIYLDKGICCYKTSRYEEAIEDLMKSHELEDKEASSLVYAGMAMANIGQWEKSIEILLMAEELLVPKDVALVYYFLGKNQAYLENTDSALCMFNKSLERDPRLTMSYYDLANIYDKKLANPKKALEYFQKFIAHDQSNTMLLEFSKHRIEKIKEELFFKGELKETN